ncbi:MAG: DUF2145 domain-containing protein [Burkholderiales bacterium]
MMGCWFRAGWLAILFVLVQAPSGWAQGAVIGACDEALPLSASQKDRLIRFAALVKAQLEASNHRVALIARSGTDLDYFDQRYSHAGISLQASSNTPWSVRQLYYDCEAAKPQVFDQGLTGFVLGVNNPKQSYVSLLLLPTAAGQAVEQVALSNQRALELLGDHYSANAHAFALPYQNCNQWVIETLAVAWGDLAQNNPSDSPLRRQAQDWLKQQAYEPTRFELGGWPLMWLSHLIPWLRHDDHPRADLDQYIFRVSMPASIETFTRQQVADIKRVEFCLRDNKVLMRRGWEPISSSCQAQEGDVVTVLD